MMCKPFYFYKEAIKKWGGNSVPIPAVVSCSVLNQAMTTASSRGATLPRRSSSHVR